VALVEFVVRIMSERDVMKRARRALAGNGKQNAPIDPAKAKELLARADAARGQTPQQTLKATPPPAPRAEQVKLPVTCSAHGVTYTVIAERSGDVLRFISHELPGASGQGASRMPGRLSGRYRIEADGWACPLCGDASGLWLCECTRLNGAMHCLGSARGLYRCACGRIEDREFANVRAAEVRGVAVGAAPRAASASTAIALRNR
jgi:hypothetical protein